MKFLSCPLNPLEGRKTEVGDSDWGHGGGGGGGAEIKRNRAKKESE